MATDELIAEAVSALIQHVQRAGDASPADVIRVCGMTGFPGDGDFVLELDPPNIMVMCGLSEDAIKVVRSATAEANELRLDVQSGMAITLIYMADGCPWPGDMEMAKRIPANGRYKKTRWAPALLKPKD